MNRRFWIIMSGHTIALFGLVPVAAALLAINGRVLRSIDGDPAAPGPAALAGARS